MAARASCFHHVPEGAYVPGRVLNDAMRATDGDVVVFLNADCVPADEDWLSTLIAPFADPAVAATFSRQLPRRGCDPLQARDTESTYGDGAGQARWRHCFSMAASAIRRSAWEAMPFREDLRYSEDIDWTWRARQAGLRIAYVADSRVHHSHHYTLRQVFRRQFGEGEAEAAIFDWSRWQRSPVRYTLLPYARQVAADWRYCLRRGALAWCAAAPIYRAAQAAGRLVGFRRGLAARTGRPHSPARVLSLGGLL
jgi:rhamnosyltransferase